MYGDALTSFGFALDAECKNNPSTSLLQALATVRPKRDKPMDLMTLNCDLRGAARRVDAERSPEREHHHDVAVRLFGRAVRQPSLRCEQGRAVRHGCKTAAASTRKRACTTSWRT
jgi:hypothetical protein